MADPRIFVSYSHQDTPFAERLVGDLQKAGAQVWYDVSGIDYGNFMRRLDQALTQCEWMVLVLTPSAIASEYVNEEVYTALQRVKQGHMRAVIPVLAAPCEAGSIPPQWDVIQRYDATVDYTNALARLLRAIGLESKATAGLPDSGLSTATPATTSSSPAASGASLGTGLAAASVPAQPSVAPSDPFAPGEDIIKSGGEWIPSAVIERAIMDHPRVFEAAVIGVPNPKWQERPVAYVVPRLEHRGTLTAEDIIAYLEPRVAKWWLPDEVIFVDSVPKTNLGKFDKDALRAQHARQAGGGRQ
jgi:hypothetical protein